MIFKVWRKGKADNPVDIDAGNAQMAAELYGSQTTPIDCVEHMEPFTVWVQQDRENQPPSRWVVTVFGEVRSVAMPYEDLINHGD